MLSLYKNRVALLVKLISGYDILHVCYITCIWEGAVAIFQCPKIGKTNYNIKQVHYWHFNIYKQNKYNIWEWLATF